MKVEKINRQALQKSLQDLEARMEARMKQQNEETEERMLVEKKMRETLYQQLNEETQARQGL